MKKKIIYSFVFSLLFAFSSYAQTSRTEAMGGISFSIIDMDTKFDPFQLGGNPAYLWISREKPRLDLTQFNNADYGNYRRKFSSERNYNVGANVLGVQPLGKSGTFQGRAIYVYNKRSEVYRTLKHDTYAGEAFYFTDTTSGDVIYNGPLFEFSHSLPITERLSLGGVFGYGLLDGLKKVYTYGQTVYRNVYGKVGATYRISDELVVGADFSLFDIQERILASDVNLFTVITYHYRGDRHRIQLSGSNQKYKVAKSGNTFGGEIFYSPDKKTEIGAYGSYSLSSTESIFPVQGVETVDGYSQFENYSFEIKARRILNERITVAAVGHYFDRNSWSKSVNTDLLLWDWKYSETGMGAGASFYDVIPGLLLAAEYRFCFAGADSSKYIDNKATNVDGIKHDLKLGGEFGIKGKYFIRGGVSLLAISHDFLYGGDNVLQKKFSAGFGANISENFAVDLFGFYASRKTENELKRDYWSVNITFRFYKF